MSTKQIVTNEEFIREYNKPENRSVIFHYSKKFNKQLPPDELVACGMRALWNALEVFDRSKGFKLVSLLGKCVTNECLKTNKEFSKFYKEVKTTPNIYEGFTEDLSNKDLVDNLTHHLSSDERRILYLKFYENRTYYEMSKIYKLSRQRMHQIVHEVLQKIRVSENLV